MKHLSHYFPEYGTGCVAKVAHIREENIQIDTLVEGYAEIKPERILMREDHLFDIASLTKTFTAILIYQAVEKGLCQLDDTVFSLNSRFVNLKEVNLLDLLAHRTEIWTDGYLGDAKSKDDFYHILFTAYVKNKNPKYVDVHYMILATILESLYHLTYREIVTNYIIEPLQLEHTVFEIHDEQLVSCNYQIVDGKEVQNIQNVLHDTKARIAASYGFTTGHAGIFTTASDLLKILISFMDGKGILLQPETIAKMLEHDDYGNYLNEQINAYALTYSIPMIRTCDAKLNLEHLLNHLEDPNLFLNNIIKPYNYAGMRYQNPYSEITTIPFSTGEHTVIFSGYTGPLYLMDFDHKIIILVMNNVCHMSQKDRQSRSLAGIHMIEELYLEQISA